MKNNLREQNEKTANKYVAKVMSVCALFIVVVYFLGISNGIGFYLF